MGYKVEIVLIPSVRETVLNFPSKNSCDQVFPGQSHLHEQDMLNSFPALYPWKRGLHQASNSVEAPRQPVSQ